MPSPWPPSGGRGEGGGPRAGVRATAVLGGHLRGEGREGHEQGEPGRETSPAGPSEGPAEGHAPGVGAAFSLGLWSQGSFRAGECSLRCTVRSGAVQIQRGELGCTCGNRKDPETTETLTGRSLPGIVRGRGGDADEQNGLLGPLMPPPPDHS